MSTLAKDPAFQGINRHKIQASLAIPDSVGNLPESLETCGMVGYFPHGFEELLKPVAFALENLKHSRTIITLAINSGKKKRNRWFTRAQVQAKTGLSPNGARHAIRQLEKLGLIEHESVNRGATTEFQPTLALVYAIKDDEVQPNRLLPGVKW